MSVTDLPQVQALVGPVGKMSPWIEEAQGDISIPSRAWVTMFSHYFRVLWVIFQFLKLLTMFMCRHMNMSTCLYLYIAVLTWHQIDLNINEYSFIKKT